MAIRREYVYKSRVFVDWKIEDKIEGVLTGFEDTTVEGRKTKAFILEGAAHIYQVLVSAQLEEIAKKELIGCNVYLENLGLVETKKNRHVRRFKVEVWKEVDDGEPEQTPTTLPDEPKASA